MLKYAVVGSGWIAEEFVKGASLVEGMEFAAMYSRTYEKGKAFAEKFADVPVYTDLNELAESDADAVYIASPNSLHYSQSKLMLEHGKHVLCEKPITISPEEFTQLFELAESKNLIYTEAIMMLHNPAREAVKNELKKIGKITTAHFDFSQLSSKYAALKRGELPNIFNPEMKTGCLRDLGIYCYYPAVDFFGLPDKIIASAGFVKTGADGYGTAVLDYADKQVTLTYSKLGEGCGGSCIMGDGGTITFGSISKFTDVRVRYADGKCEKISGEIPKHQLMAFEAKSFYNYIKNRRDFREEYLEKNEKIFAVNKLLFEAAVKCEID